MSTVVGIAILVVVVIPVYVYILGKSLALGWVQAMKQLLKKENKEDA